MVDKALGILALLVGITALAVLVSKKSNTAAVISSLLNGIAGVQRAAVSPITGK